MAKKESKGGVVYPTTVALLKKKVRYIGWKKKDQSVGSNRRAGELTRRGGPGTTRKGSQNAFFGQGENAKP